MTITFFDNIMYCNIIYNNAMLRFDKTKVTKQEFYDAKKSALIETKKSPKYLFGYLDEVIRKV